MKLQIDTDNKTVTIDETLNLGELLDALYVMFPKFAWREYAIVPVKVIEHWTSPVIIPWIQQPVLPWYTPVMVPLTNPTTSPNPFNTPITITGGTSCGVGVTPPKSNLTATKLDNKNVTYTTKSVYNVIISNNEGKN